MRFKKIYIEITNTCNFNCSFCVPSDRKRKIMSVDEFSYILQKIKPYTHYIYLHVLGEPLLHPHLGAILQIANSAAVQVNISTNGLLLKKNQHILLQSSVRQVNISLHDIEENLPKQKWLEYLNDVLGFVSIAAASTYINLRLWNSSCPSSNEFNSFICSQLSKYFQVDSLDSLDTRSSAVKLTNRVFLQHAPRFIWPNADSPHIHNKKSCYALRDHIAILANGEVVPCCIDANANMQLGNIFEQELPDILLSERAQQIKKGFELKNIVEDFCKTCGFMIDKERV